MKLCELVWVLETAYRYPRAEVALVLDKILRTKQFEIENHQDAWASLLEYQQGADFADAFIRSTGVWAAAIRRHSIAELRVVMGSFSFRERECCPIGSRVVIMPFFLLRGSRPKICAGCWLEAYQNPHPLPLPQKNVGEGTE